MSVSVDDGLEINAPWQEKESYQILFLVLTLFALVVIAIAGPLMGVCKTSDASCMPSVASPSLGLSSVTLYDKCPCNSSSVIRNSTNARTLSNTIFGVGDPLVKDERSLSQFSVFFAQFILNDIYRPTYNPANDYLVPIPPGDPFFGPSFADIKTKVPTTLMDTNSCPVPTSNTSYFIDLSNVYGSTVEEMSAIRTFHGGELKSVTFGTEGSLLPFVSTTDQTWFLMGDLRDNYNAGLITLHTLAVRNHNFWANQVRSFHWDWVDDQIFWKARQLNIADWQRILYFEWLPAILGPIAPFPTSGYLLTPDTSIEPRVSNEFVNVIMPAFIDTMMTDKVSYHKPEVVEIPYSVFADRASAVQYIVETGIDEFLKASMSTVATEFDDKVIPNRRNIINGTNVAIDWVTIHLQRARALRIQDWAAMYTCFGPTPIAGDPRDAYEGFLQEPIYPGSSVGLTTATAMADQFLRIRNSDPNYYYFNQAQIGSVYWGTVNGITMNHLIERNTKSSILSTHLDPFHV